MVTFSDNFNRSDTFFNASPWQSSIPSAWKIVNNAAEVMTTSTVAIVALAENPMATSDMSVKMKIDTYASGSVSILGRADTNFTGYYAVRLLTAGISIVKVINGSLTTLASSTTAPVAGMVVELRMYGTTIEAWAHQNGTSTKVTSVVDSSVVSGNIAGFRTNGSSVGYRLDEFEASDYTNASTPGDTAVPSNVPSLAVSNVTYNSATISHGAATDDTGVAGYEARVTVTGTGASISGSPFTYTGLSKALSGLAASTGYTVSSRAYDAAGKYSATPSVTTFTTPSAPVASTGTKDDFNRSDASSLSSPWLLSATGAVGIVSSAAQVTSTASSVVAAYSTLAPTSDMYCKAKFSSLTSTFAIVARADETFLNYYGVRRASSSAITIIKVLGGGSFTSIASFDYALQEGDIMEIRCIGTKISAVVNNVELGNATDGSISSGQGGAFRTTASAQGLRFDDFEIGQVVSGSDTTPPTAPGVTVDVGQTSATLRVTTPSTDASGISGYQYYRGTTLLATTTALSYVITGLTADTAYNGVYGVVGLDAASSPNASSKTTVSFRTNAANSTGSTISLWYSGSENRLGTSEPAAHATNPLWGGLTEYGLSYGNKLSYWTGTQEAELTLQDDRPAFSRWVGKRYAAWGDSSSVLQTTGGVDYTAAETWSRLVGSGFGGTDPDPSAYPNGLNVTTSNKHANSATMQDVATRMLLSGGTSEYVPGTWDVVSVFAGGNDVGFQHATDRGRAAYKNSMSAILGILRHKTRVSARSAETGSWAIAGTNYSGNTRVSSTNGDTTTITFTGSNATLILLALRSGAGSQFTYQVDGGQTISGTTKNQAQVVDLNSDYAPVPLHIRGLSSGSHTVKVTHTGAAGDPLVVDSVFVWATTEAEMPFVLIVPPGLFSTKGAGLYPTPKPTNTDVGEFRTMFNEVLATFSHASNIGKVLANRIDVAFPPDDTTIRISDGLHPNKQGHRIIASVMLETLRQYSPT
jgi:lysophospholipase L1-like esterase